MRKLTTLFLAGILVAMSVLFATDSVGHAQKVSGEKDAERVKVASMIEKGDTAGADKLMSQLQSKSPQNNHGVQGPNFNVSFEEIKACGFYPQETRLECIVEIKQKGGYGGPIGSFGSLEFVNFCVDWDDNGIFFPSEYVGLGAVHVHDEIRPPPLPAKNPSWHYAVYRDFDVPGGRAFPPNLDLRTTPGGNVTTTTSFGPSRRARAILSWAVPAIGCNQVPVWGNVFNFQIRFDPIR